MLGEEKHGCWQLCPAGEIRSVRRRYRPDTLVLETEFETADGVVRLTDCMPRRGKHPDVVRLAEGVQGRVGMRLHLAARFDYGGIAPITALGKEPGTCTFMAGPDALILRTCLPLRLGPERTVEAEFALGAGERVPFVLSWHRSYEPPPEPLDAEHEIAATEAWWRDWIGRCTCREGPWAQEIRRSLITLKALIYGPSGGIVAAPTAGLPEVLGGVRNWDYRFCWLRDAAITLGALVETGFKEEAQRWRDWLLRAVAADPANLQILYGLDGERRLLSFELTHLPGYENSRPLTVGNEASTQLQLDVYGEVAQMFYHAGAAVFSRPEPAGIDQEMFERSLKFLESHWKEPDAGIWEMRGPKRHFVYSKAMAWVAVDRMVRRLEEIDTSKDCAAWKQMRDDIHREVCEQGYDTQRGAFTQFYGSQGLDASVLLLPVVGFLPGDDPRMRSTVAAVERELLQDGLVVRYQPGVDAGVDGLPGTEGAFIPCSLWLANCYWLQGRRQEAQALFERVISLCSDLGLLSEEYDCVNQRMLGNFPQAFSHVSLVYMALQLRRSRQE